MDLGGHDGGIQHRVHLTDRKLAGGCHPHGQGISGAQLGLEIPQQPGFHAGLVRHRACGQVGLEPEGVAEGPGRQGAVPQPQQDGQVAGVSGCARHGGRVRI
ncbi:hypothetical protein ACFFX0_15870 [Citricoccus parietis]|uniref:Uncharacterized protein n=1 Tax=Citricoccus parietis TaxID=592307 RepID=A0ABV5G108_9MICC